MQAVQVDRTLYISGQLGLNNLAELVPGGVERETEKVAPTCLLVCIKTKRFTSCSMVFKGIVS
jgi:enamine deaminase RidA (YjgF/YER057c/UK114 family)